MSDSESCNEGIVRYTHDCKLCVYLGQYGKYDMYFCEQRSTSRYGRTVRSPTLVARYSDYGPDYISGLPPRVNGVLLIAEELAIRKGLIDPRM